MFGAALSRLDKSGKAVYIEEKLKFHMKGTMKPSIWHHSLFAYQGGAARVANTLACGLAAAGWPVRQTFEVRDARHEGLLATPAELPGLVPPADILHIHTVKNWLACLNALLERPNRLLITLHDTRLAGGDPTEPLEQLAGPLHALAPLLVAPSRWLLDLFRQRLDPEEKLALRLVPNGVGDTAECPEPTRTRREEQRRKWGIAPGAKVLLFSAHGGEKAVQKGGERWQEIWLAVKAMHPDALGIMAGGEEHGREGDLLRLPYMDSAELHGLLIAADIFLYPSLADNHPLAVLEALAAGTPVLAFATGGIPEQLEAGRTGWLVPHGNWAAFCRAAAHILGDSAGLRAAGRAAYESWQQRFTLRHMVAGYEAVYGDLLSL